MNRFRGLITAALIITAICSAPVVSAGVLWIDDDGVTMSAPPRPQSNFGTGEQGTLWAWLRSLIGQ